MSEPTKAVFLSYASQDAEAAGKICDALRSGGVEVWFDAEGGLEHGDEWDAKIRRQIKECVLFIPVISANTQARLEGYFRIEWELASQRALGIASGVPFILPVVIDDTREPDALVPDRFRTVQWTRLKGGEVPPEVQQRFLKLWSHRSGVLKHEAAHEAPVRAAVAASDPARRSFRALAAAVGAVALVAAAVFISRLERAPQAAAPSPGPVATTATPSEAARITARAYELTQRVGFTRDDLGVATDLTTRATELETASGRAWAVRAWVQACYLMRNWDLTDRKLQEVQTLANHALALASNDADAMNALYMVFEKQRASAEAEKIARRAIAAAPENYRSYLCLGRALNQLQRRDEALAVANEAVKRFPNNVLCRYELATFYASIGTVWAPATPADVAASLAQLDAAIAIQPFGSAILLKAVSVAAWRGDLKTMQDTLDRLETLPLADRTEDRAVAIAMWAGLLEQRPDRVLAAARLTARPYFEDSIVAGPKAWDTAMAYRSEGKESLERQEWLAAETTLRQRLQDAATDPADTIRLATTLAWLGRLDEAATVAAPVEAAWREDLNTPRARQLALYYGARGEAAKAAPYVRRAINLNTFLTDHLLPLDPWWDKLRGQPEFAALLTEAKVRIAAASGAGAPASGTAAAATDSPARELAAKAVPEDKSVAVLAFADLSAARDSEYFSDGISEELLNVLAKVPGLKVTARTSAFFFKGKNLPIPEIAQKLGVAYVIEGSVQRAGEQIKITAQLIKATDGFHVWSDTFKRDAKDVFAVEEEIAGLIAKQLSLKLGVSSAAATAIVNPQAFELYVQARQAWNLRTAAGFDHAEELLNRALALEPDFARAHAALADVWLARSSQTGTLGAFDQRKSPERERILTKIQQALALDSESAEAHASLGVLSWFTWDFVAAERALRRAIILSPNYASAHQWLGRVLECDGLMSEALTELKLASEIDPLSAVIAGNYGGRLLEAGRYIEAIRALDQALLLQPDLAASLAHKADTLLALNRQDEAVALADRFPAGDINSQFYQIRILAAAGLKDKASALFASYPVKTRNPRSLPLLALGQRDEALSGLDARSFNVNFVGYVMGGTYYDSIRSEPLFAQFLAELGLTEAHARAQAWRSAHPPEKPEAKK